MRKALLIIIGVTAIGGFVWIGNFYRANLQGIWSAVLGPQGDIAEVLDTEKTPLSLPPGFSISVFAKGLGGPRVMAYDPAGNLVVSIPSQGRVVALPDRNGDGVADEIVTVVDGLNSPHGLATRCTEKCEFYIAETDKVAVYDYDAEKLKATNKRKIIDLPAGGGHTTRTLLFMPAPNDHRLLISVGSSCNVCNEEDSRRAKVLISNADGGDLKEFAKGLRNSVFMAIHPVTGDIWATEMGRDLLGDDTPPDEVNILKEGGNYGWPVCYGSNVHDTDFDKNVYFRNPCMAPFETPSRIDVPAHSAPLGLAFVPEEGWPQEYWHNLLVAYHGSWNRSVPTGYKIVRYKLDAQGKGMEREDFISGWLTDEGVWGRPVDILVQPGGTIFISDDKAGVIYRVKYSPPGAGQNTKDVVRNISIKENDTVKSPLVVSGEARGFWFFEASFPIRLYDANGKELAVGIAQANPPAGGDWMTTEYVPFRAELVFTKPASTQGTLVLQKDNPSGLPEHDASITLPIKFDPNISDKPSKCVVSGCSGQICSDKQMVSTCEWREEYACYQTAKCEVQPSGQCGWTQTSELKSCLEASQ
jgi:glucose/arabinose dehydrogenase